MNVINHLEQLVLCITVLIYIDINVEAMGLCEFEERLSSKRSLPPSCHERGNSTEQVTGINTTLQVKPCPANMVLGDCQRCETTCQDPSGAENCHIVCSQAISCICPEGYFMNEEKCVPKEDCPCYSFTAAAVIPEGSSYIDSQCVTQCVCQGSELSCNTSFSCNANADCENRDDGYQCYCNDGFNGDGLTCTPRDCLDIYNNGFIESGVYAIYPTGWPNLPFNVYCNMDDGGGWTVFQSRFDGHVDFYRNWESYKQGFGDLDSEFWLGNEKLYYLTNQKWYKLRLDMTDKYGYGMYAIYDLFRIEGSSAKYRMSHLGTYSGSIGHDYFTFHLGMFFSTYDSDNDAHLGKDCSTSHHGAWWYRDCYAVNLNGQYEGGEFTGMLLYNWDSYSTDYFLRKSQMRLRPV